MLFPKVFPGRNVDMKLKAVTVEALQATDKRQEIPDDLCAGLYLVVQPTGKKAGRCAIRQATWRMSV